MYGKNGRGTAAGKYQTNEKPGMATKPLRTEQKYLEFNFVTCYDRKKGKPEKRPTLFM
ncbi:hypothetical protein C808_00649 [Lachnospiraceae bacterium M18-1]|nr:hypothetical protein C808_00649 [Lachnospiraceae bacterium M18-1]